MKFYFQYRREQRVTFLVEAASEEEAERLAELQSERFNLSSEDDESDDPGEVDMVEVVEGEL